MKSPIRLVLTDVDGVLTDGRITLTDHGEELKSFHVRDGSGVKHLQRADIEVAIVTGRVCRAVTHRARELGIAELHQGRTDKLTVLEDLLARRGLRADEVAYIGDDLLDLPVLTRVGLAGTPADGHREVKAVCTFVADSPGGHGAFREFAEYILKQQGLWQQTLDRYRAGLKATDPRP